MAEDILAGMSHEKVEGTRIEAQMQEQAKEKMGAGSQGAGAAATTPNRQSPGVAPAASQTVTTPGVSFFGTLGLAWLSVSNRAIGGEEITFEGEPALMGAKNMDDVVIKTMLQAGGELDAKYIDNQWVKPEIRYGLSIALFYMLKGRIAKAKAWVDARQKTRQDADNPPAGSPPAGGANAGK